MAEGEFTLPEARAILETIRDDVEAMREAQRGLRAVKAELTPREREVAAFLMDGLTSKEIGKVLAISHRTVEIYRARLMRKYTASTTADLVHKLMAG